MQANLVQFLVGIILLALGRRLFWIFVGAVGFIAGFALAAQYFAEQSVWVMLLFAGLLGLLGMGLALFLQRLAVGIAGFAAGAYIALTLGSAFGLTGDLAPWIWLVAGGVIGTVLLAVAFDWALIVLSALTGAIFCAQALNWSPPLTILLAVILFVIGVALQANLLRAQRRG
ncbi:MAG TPA: hypothetical protein VLS48_08080 [Anaerolineales bacterium]|nr:hypothetical protein [Anaerolineales bacterium]